MKFRFSLQMTKSFLYAGKETFKDSSTVLEFELLMETGKMNVCTHTQNEAYSLEFRFPSFRSYNFEAMRPYNCHLFLEINLICLIQIRNNFFCFCFSALLSLKVLKGNGLQSSKDYYFDCPL